MGCPLQLLASCDSWACLSPGDTQVAGRIGSDRTGCGTSPYTPGPGHTRTPLWLWTGARPGTEHPSVSAPASLCILFLLSVSCSHSFSFHLSYRSASLFPGQPSGFSHYVTLGMHFPVYLFPSLSLLTVICLQRYASDPRGTSGDVAPLSPHLRKLLGTPDLGKPHEIQVLKGCFRH